MDKISIALTSGNTIEKPLVSAFKGNMGTYVVLDNEANGTMGLPIILVSKLNDNKLEKIMDANEWNTVKEYLRNIIAGNQMDFVRVANNYAADDAFFNQLTLPVASFDALKANYKPIDESGVAPAIEPQNVVSEPAQVEEPTPVPTPVVPDVTPVVETPVMPEVVPNIPDAPAVEVTPIPNVTPMQETAVTPIQEEIQPMPNMEPVAPVMPEAPINQTVDTFTPVQEAPAVEPIPDQETQEKVDFTVDKEAFLKACENMFDALVAKINK